MKNSKLMKQIKDKIEKLAGLVDKALFSEEIQKYLKTVSKFHRYSPNNQWLIMAQYPDATHVAGYVTWQKKFKRHVKGGEKAIKILAPHTYEKKDENGKVIETHQYFKDVSVFDILQTEGEPLDELDVWKSKEKLPVLENAMKQYAQKLGLTVSSDARGQAEGFLNTHNEIHLKADTGTQTLAHEIAHFVAGHLKDEKSKETKELEAEVTAHVVCEHFGLTNGNSVNYLALWGLTAENLRNSLNTVSELSKELITGIEQELSQELKQD